MADLTKTDLTKFITPGKIKTINASVTLPENAGLRFILNPCSLTGKWDSKLQKVLSKKWTRPQLDFKSWCANTTNFKLGQLQSISVQSDVWVINLLCLDKNNKVDEKAFENCLKGVLKLAKSEKASAHVSTLVSEVHGTDLTKYSKDLSLNGVHIYFYDGDK